MSSELYTNASVLQSVDLESAFLFISLFILTTLWGLAESELVFMLSDEFTAGDAFIFLDLTANYVMSHISLSYTSGTIFPLSKFCHHK